MQRREALRLIFGGLAFAGCKGVGMPKWYQNDPASVNNHTASGRINSDITLEGTVQGHHDLVYWEVPDHVGNLNTVDAVASPELDTEDAKGYQGTISLPLEGWYDNLMVAENGGRSEVNNNSLKTLTVLGMYVDGMAQSMIDFGFDEVPMQTVSPDTWEGVVWRGINPADLSDEAQNQYARLQNYISERQERGIAYDDVSLVGNNVIYHLDKPGFFHRSGKTVDRVFDRIDVGQELATVIKDIIGE